MWRKWSPSSTASPSSTIYIFQLHMAHTAVYCLQSTLPIYTWHTLQCTACSQHFPSAHGTHFSVLPAVNTSYSPVCQYPSTLYTNWDDCNHATVSVMVSIIKQWLAAA
jgi:hypothetical protein